MQVKSLNLQFATCQDKTQRLEEQYFLKDGTVKLNIRLTESYDLPEEASFSRDAKEAPPCHPAGPRVTTEEKPHEAGGLKVLKDRLKEARHEGAELKTELRKMSEEYAHLLTQVRDKRRHPGRKEPSRTVEDVSITFYCKSSQSDK